MKVCMRNLPTLVCNTMERSPASASIQPQQGHSHGARQETQNDLHWGCFEAEVGFWGMVRYTLGRLMFMPSLVSLGWQASDLEAVLCLAQIAWSCFKSGSVIVKSSNQFHPHKNPQKERQIFYVSVCLSTTFSSATHTLLLGLLRVWWSRSTEGMINF